MNLVCGRSKSLADVALLLGSRAHATPPSKVTRLGGLKKIFRFSKPQAHLQCQQPEAGAQFGECSSFTMHLGPIQWVNDDILLSIFNSYRLDEDNAWNTRLGWCKLSHVCRRWRHLIYELASHLGMHIECTNGTPIVDTLDHLPPLPLFVDYWCEDVTIREQDASGIYHALLLSNRVRHIDLHLPPSILHKFLMLMGEPFPILEHLSLSFEDDKITTLTLPKAFLAPNLRHLTLLGICLPKRLRLLSSTASLVTLTLTKIRASSFFRPRLLVARLQSLPGLEELSIGFSIPIPRPSAERELLGKQGILVTLLSLKKLTFQGVSAYLECLVAQIRTPLLEQLHITLFNQIVFTLPHLSHLIDITEGLKLHAARVFFERNEASITTANNTLLLNGPFYLRVMCKQLDWQINCVAQICSALMPALSGVEQLMLNLYDEMMPEWQNGEIDGTTWHELLRSFTGVKVLHIGHTLSEELSRALDAGEVGSDPRLLPSLQEIANEFEGEHADGLFGSFIQCRQVAGSPVRLLSPNSETPFYSEISFPRSSVTDLITNYVINAAGWRTKLTTIFGRK
ncbi:hypothetical protein H4582DRAFT_1126248 [Lactarius indigo]|nr:hypothetical protein H4582DRAFT_1126248 [Lactarius indigo]